MSPADEMVDWAPARRLRYALPVGLGLGLLAGALEAVALAFSLRLPLGFGAAWLLGLVDAALMGLVGLALAAATGPIHWVLRGRPTSSAVAVHAALVGWLLTGLYLWQAAAGMVGDGRTAGAIAIVVVPFAIGAAVFFQARHQLQKVEIGAEYPVGFATMALGASAVVAGLAAAIMVVWPSLGPPPPVDGGRSVVIVSIDTLRRDHVGTYGEITGLTPNIDRLAAEGVVFLDAVTPMPETAPAHASMLTGLHPLRHHVLSNGHALRGGYTTVPELLQERGWATGAFVSSYAVDARTGLAQGFQVYDDALAPGLRGLVRLSLPRLALRGWMAKGDPARTPWLLERDGAETVDAFQTWIGGVDDQTPFFAWVHLFEPHAPYERHDGEAALVDHRSRMGPHATWTDGERRALKALYAGEVTRADALVGEVIDTLRARGLDDTLVIVVADHGEMLGEHRMDFVHHGLWEPVVRVPLVMGSPGLPVNERRVEAQVRLMDVGATVLEWTAVSHDRIEGIGLMEYASGRRAKSLGATLVGRRSRSFADGALIGARHGNVKYVRDLVQGQETVFLLDDDPGEQTDLVGWYREHAPDDLDGVRGVLADETVAFEKLLGSEVKVSASTAQMLDALGYQE